jgi:Ras-related protein Rab-11A
MNFDDDYDMIFKVVLIGDSGVGKSNILSRYIRDEFSIETKSTVGVEFGSKKLKIKGVNIKAQIWDTAGQERYKSITNAYYKGAKGALVVFDISRKETFTTIDRWIGELKGNADNEVSIILIGNKSDLEEHRQVTQEEAKIKAEQYNLAYLETSALQAINIDKSFNMMIEGNCIFHISYLFSIFKFRHT